MDGLSLLCSIQSEVLVVCLETSDDPTVNDHRNFLLAMSEMGMVTSEYVIIYLETWRQQGFGLPTPIWVDTNTPSDGRDAVAKQAANIALVLDLQPNVVSDTFDRDVLANIEKWPFYCKGCADGQTSASVQAASLADAFYLWALALNRSIAQQGDSAIANGDFVMLYAKGTFQGFSGTVVLDENGNRQPIYRLYGKVDGALDDRNSFVVITTNGNDTASG
uniref:Receptor ligand binding region domain-containing protein n=1 Tax=Acrobeloides nanus TaxID=290746 RepID=A0A914D520_9BILA